jgi:hypothetical protein
MEDNLEYLATLETIDNESQSANLAQLISLIVSITPLFRGVIRADEGSISEHDKIH